MFPFRLFRSVFALVALAPFAAADILTVGPAGGGAQFTEIQAAIDAAQDDDVILVQAGTYQRIVVDKPLRILGEGPDSVTISYDGSGVFVRGIGAGEELVLSGMKVGMSIPLSSPPVLLEDCPGTVVLQDMEVFVLEWYARTALRVENCARMVLLDCRVTSRQGNRKPERRPALPWPRAAAKL